MGSHVWLVCCCVYSVCALQETSVYSWSLVSLVVWEVICSRLLWLLAWYQGWMVLGASVLADTPSLFSLTWFASFRLPIVFAEGVLSAVIDNAALVHALPYERVRRILWPFVPANSSLPFFPLSADISHCRLYWVQLAQVSSSLIGDHLISVGSISRAQFNH